MKSKSQAPPPKEFTENDIFTDEFLANLMRLVGSEVEIAPSARSLFYNIASDFVNKLTQDSINIAKTRNSGTLEEKDVLYALQHIYKIEIPTSENIQLINTSPPSDEYLAKLDAIRADK
ncbi:hypothetical protein TRFO_06773 [Tritrichomonas foetus]|uniref:Transcription initiation factor TFIID subunit 12 domain-containing protein n=1 Tax=Tritrichomonas foetus TaxID=1144522 RepID=A0A1J4K0V1_9EUKA|nr:hypothetical protein TRFO_06773 [Tritrichomonas foetus]|eukprot:OHT03125.1 hypothetical protein TRFO_06773 [Tritrichomonas foetus]